jgi:spermidine synthase
MDAAQHRASSPANHPHLNRAARAVVYAAAALAAFSAVAYELLLASYATFLMGATLFQYSIVISLMMASMGVGALLTHNLSQGQACRVFFWIEIALAVLASIAIPLLYTLFALEWAPQVAVISLVLAMGVALGMEVPLLGVLLPGDKGLTRILFFDYLGGFAGGVLFPIYLLPQLGFFRLAAALAVLNACIALGFAITLGFRRLAPFAYVAMALGVSALFFAESLRRWLEVYFFSIGGSP